MEIMKIKTEFVHPPIPNRSFDYSAIDDDSYDGPGCPIGYGVSPQDAINDLLEQIQAQADHDQPYEPEWPSDEEIGRREHFGRYDEDYSEE